MENQISVEHGQQLLLEHAAPPSEIEQLPVSEALGRVLWEPAKARIDQPPFNRSPLDGYALRHSDVQAASRAHPAVLSVCRAIYAGDPPGPPLSPGTAARIMTGAPIPEGATCVIRQEATAEQDGVVQVFTSLSEHENFCFQGEDVKRGTMLIPAGQRLGAAHIGVLAGQGYNSVRVYRRPRVYILSTGSELAVPGSSLSPGKIYESNRAALSARSTELGAQVLPGASVVDDPERIAASLSGILPACDLLVTTGGVSVGERDYLPEVASRIGSSVLFKGVAAKPGGPVMALTLSGKLLLCLSGNPFAAWTTFELLAVPVIRRLAGEREVIPRRVRGVLDSPFPKASSGRRFVRARIEGGTVFVAAGGHGSGMLSGLVGCNCLLDIPAGSGALAAGDPVEALLF